MESETHDVSNVLKRSLVMRRILKEEPKNRIATKAMVEKELCDFMRYNCMDYSKTVNLALEKYLTEKGFDPENPIKIPQQ